MVMELLDVDTVPTNVEYSKSLGHLMLLEDNQAVIKICAKRRSPQLRHVLRTHRVDLDFLYNQLLTDPNLHLHFVPTKQQLADLLTKGSFTELAWADLVRMVQIGPRTM